MKYSGGGHIRKQTCNHAFDPPLVRHTDKTCKMHACMQPNKL